MCFNHYWQYGSPHRLTTPQSQQSGINPQEIRYNFLYWLKNGFTHLPNPVDFPVTANESYIAYYTKQYIVTMNHSPSNGGTTNPSDDSWANAGTTINFSASPYTGYVFDHWIVNGNTYNTTPYPVQINSPTYATSYFRVSSPTFEPASGATLPRPFNVAISCDNTQAIVYYTLDGTEPSTNSSVYSLQNQPLITGTTNVTLKAKAFVNGVIASITSTAQYPYSPPPPKTLNLSLFLEGLYAGFGNMIQAKEAIYDELGNVIGIEPKWTDGSADRITIELHSSLWIYDPGCMCNVSDYPTIIFSAIDIPLNIDGTAIVSVPGEYSGSYYVTIKHRNSIETTSALPVDFAGTTISYAFDLASKAFGANMTTIIEADETISPPLIFGGDVTQDGQVESDDMNQVGNDAANFLYGYRVTDVYGDGMVEANDLNITSVNAALFVQMNVP